MKLSSKAIQLFATTIVALLILAATIIAAPTRTSTTASLQATHGHAATNQPSFQNSLDPLHGDRIIEEDHFALRTNHFNMPQPTLYAIATLASHGPAIRRARIRRKGNLHG
jgi:hypothetical protein